MKRHRVFGFSFDTRIIIFKSLMEINDLIGQNKETYDSLADSFKSQYGTDYFDNKIQNLIDIGAKNFSVVAYHNIFLEQVRHSFVVQSYYPSLTGACALGERILNHLILNLRDSFKNTPDYQKVYRKNSFDKWELVIDILSKWNVLLPRTVELFLELKDIRNRSLHFNIETETNVRQEALKAVVTIQAIIDEQFSGFSTAPWFIGEIPGEIYIKKSWEEDPFVKLVYIPNSYLVGSGHKIKSMNPFQISDFMYSGDEISDEEFIKLRLLNNNGS